jgi:regulator of replication initiation timing
MAAAVVQKENGVTDRDRVDSVPVAEDAVRKVQRLKKAMARGRGLLGEDQGAAGSALASELRQWEEQLEAIRCDVAELLAERDRMRIAHDKLRERIDRHTLEPRSEPERKIQALPQPARPRPSGESQQDFTAIDRELERLNASMLRAFSSE